MPKTSGPTDIAILAKNYEEYLRAAALDPQEQSLNIATTQPLRSLQNLLQGMRLGELTVLGGYPGHGKSALAQQIAFGMAAVFAQDAEPKRRVAYYTLEMGQKQLLARHLIQNVPKVPYLHLVNPYLITEQEWGRIGPALRELADKPLNLKEGAGLSLEEIRRSVDEINQDGPVKLIVIDYLHMLAEADGGDETAVLKSILTATKALAIDNHAHVILLSALNRGEGGAKFPNMQSYRGHSSIEHTADVGVFIHRPSLMDMGLEADWGHYGAFIVAKARSSAVGWVPLEWDETTLTYKDTQPYIRDNLKPPRGRGRGGGSYD